MPNDLHEQSAFNLLNQGEVAKLLSVSVSTVSRWSREGLLPTIVLPSGRRRFRRQDVDALLQIGESA